MSANKPSKGRSQKAHGRSIKKATGFPAPTRTWFISGDHLSLAYTARSGAREAVNLKDSLGLFWDSTWKQLPRVRHPANRSWNLYVVGLVITPSGTCIADGFERDSKRQADQEHLVSNAPGLGRMPGTVQFEVSAAEIRAGLGWYFDKPKMARQYREALRHIESLEDEAERALARTELDRRQQAVAAILNEFNRAADADSETERRKPPKNDERDRWLTEQYQLGHTYATVMSMLRKEINRGRAWDAIESVPGVRGAIMRYAARHGIVLRGRK
jgi:hypothetical protein